MPARTRTDIERIEDQMLVGYALRASASRGRAYPEAQHAYRTCFQRDRDRIIHADAFRRLKYKTQVFINWAGDHFRTRLTHSVEVAQCARTIARALGLNEEVCEAIALAHDLGHTPFGHAGEEAMRELMRDHGGYEHNEQSLRIVDLLERRYPEFPGLNLTSEVRHGLMKHETSYDRPVSGQQDPRSPSLEAQVVNLADEISYNAHDTEDGLYSGLLTVERGCEATLFEEAMRYAHGRGIANDPKRQRYLIVGYLKNVQVSDLIEATAEVLDRRGMKTIEDVYAYRGEERLVTFSPEMMQKVGQLKRMLYDNLYKHRRVLQSMEKATRFIGQMFARYIEDPYLMGGGFHNRVEKDGESPHRVVCDYISGMTDRYALEQYRRLFDPDVW